MKNNRDRQIQHPFPIEKGMREHLDFEKKILALAESAISWQECHERHRADGTPITFNDAKVEVGHNSTKVSSVVRTLTKAELAYVVHHFAFLNRKVQWEMSRLREEFKLLKKQREIIRDGLRSKRTKLSLSGKKAAEALHGQPGGSRSKAELMRTIWASGKYDSRDICAEQECAGLNMSFSTARKALRNTPKPT